MDLAPNSVRYHPSFDFAAPGSEPMLFNSTEFIPFLLLVLLVHWVLIPARFAKARKGFLVAASYAFYMSWNPKFGLLLLPVVHKMLDSR